MARPKPKAAELLEPAPLEFEELLSAEDVNPALERIYSEMGVDAEGRKSNVYVYVDKGDGESRIWAGSPDDYSLDTLTKKFGSGDYRVKVYVQHESGRMVVAANQVIKILLEPAEDARIAAARNPAHIQQAPQQNTADLATAIAAAIAAAMPKPQPQADPMIMLSGLANVIKQMQPAQSATPAAPAMDAMAMFKLGLELAGKAGGGEPSDPMTKLIETFGPVFADVLTKQSAQPAQPAQPVQPAQIEGPQPGEDAMLFDAQHRATLAIKAGLSQLIDKARQNKDPALYAELVADNVGDDAINELLTNPQWLEYLAQYNPQVRNFAPWFTKMRDALAAMYESSDPEAGDNEAGTGAAPVVDAVKKSE